MAAVLAVLCCATACNGTSPEAAIVPAPSAPPAGALLAHVAMPKDFHISYRTHYLADGPLVPNAPRFLDEHSSGSGEVVLQPRLMASLHETNTFCSDRCPIDEIVDGTDRYTKSPQSSWSLDKEIGLDYYNWSAILPSTLRQSTAVSLLGAQRLDGFQTWVVDAQMPNGQPFRVWLRHDNGYPVRLTSSPNAKTPYVDIQIDATNFDGGIVINDPPRNQLDPLYWGTQYKPEQAIPSNGGSITVHILVYNCHGGPDLYDSRNDGIFVLMPFTYTAGSAPLPIDPSEWLVYDTFAHPYQPVPLGAGPALVAQTVPPGESRSGDICFFLPWNQDHFALVGDLPGGFITRLVGGASLPDSSDQVSPIGS